MSEQGILLITHGHFEKNFLDKIAADVEKEFLHTVDVVEGKLEITDFYDPTRRQYDGNKLLLDIFSKNPSGILKKVGLFRVDLFIPILTYIFGQATYKGNIGIASLYRLRNEQYGMKKDEALLINRFTKIVIHELGHMSGLIHCHGPNCVMRSSTYVEDIDQKSKHFCAKCRTQINE